jgi:chromate transporter
MVANPERAGRTNKLFPIRELVDRKRWISQSRFLHALNYCMLLPRPEAQLLAIYIGWLLHKT